MEIEVIYTENFLPFFVFYPELLKTTKLFSIFTSQPSQNITVKLTLFAMSNAQRLTNGQALLLELFHQDLTENDLQEVRNILSRHFAQKARVEIGRASCRERV